MDFILIGGWFYSSIFLLFGDMFQMSWPIWLIIPIILNFVSRTNYLKYENNQPDSV